MDNWVNGFGWGMVLMFLLSIFFVICAYQDGKESGYKSGQTDALKGNFKYKMVTVQKTELIKRDER